MANTINTVIKLRTDTLTNWSTSIIKLAKGEAALGYDSTSGKYEIRIGDSTEGGKTWNELLGCNIKIPAANVTGLLDSLYDYQLVESTDGTIKLQKKLSTELNWTDVSTVSLAFTGTYNNDSTDTTNYNPIALKDYVDSHVAAATTQYFEGTRSTVAAEDNRPETDSEVLARITTGVTVKGGSTAVIKTAIANTDPTKYSYIAFTYDTTTDSSNPAWKAMDGNYDAKNVYMDSNITYTANIGTINDITTSKTKGTFECGGKSVYDTIKDLMSKTLNPTVTNPSYSLAIGTITTSAGNKNTGNEVEAGTTVTKIAWNGTFTDGTYSYKSQEAPNDTKANCVPSYSMSNDKSATATSETTEDGTYTLPSAVTIEAPTAAGTATKDNTLITITGNCSYAASTRTPYNNIQDTVPSLKIPASSSPIAKSATAILKGYHNGVYFGGIKSAKYTASQLKADPSLLRTALSVKNVSGYSTYGANTKNNAGARPNTFKFVADSGTYTIVIAVKGTRTLSSAFNDSVFAEMASSFEADKETGVVIPGAGEDAGTEYTVWTYSPVDVYGSEVKMSITMAG